MKYSPNLGGGKKTFTIIQQMIIKMCVSTKMVHMSIHCILKYYAKQTGYLWNNFTSLFFHNFLHHFTESMIYIQCSTSF